MMVLSDGSNVGWRKYFLAGWAFLECWLFAGTFYGWSSMVFVFKDEGIFADLCQSTNTTRNDIVNVSDVATINGDAFSYDSVNVTRKDGRVYVAGTESSKAGAMATKTGFCVPQESMFALCFTISSAIFCASCFLTGHINFKFGTRITRLIAFPLFIAGTLCFAFISTDLPWLMFPGLCLVGVGGVPLLMTNTQISNLFQKGSSSVVGLLCGGYDMSAVIMLIIKIAYEKGIPRRTMFVGLTVVHAMTLISTFFFLPAGFVKERTLYRRESQTVPTLGEEALLERYKKRRRPSIAETQPLGSYVLQPLYITHNIWLCLLHLRYFYFLGGINAFLNRALDGDKQQVSYFTDVCFYTMMCGIVTSFFAGIVYDWVKAFLKSGETDLYRNVLPAAVPQTIASVLALIMSVLVMFPSPSTLYILFIVMTLYRSFLYGLAAAFISAIVPSQYFAVLYGLTMLIAAVFGCLQYAFFSWAEAYPLGEFHGELCLLCMAIISLCHPVYMTVVCLREERSVPQPAVTLLQIRGEKA